MMEDGRYTMENKQQHILEKVPNNSKKKIPRKIVRTNQLTLLSSDAHIITLTLAA